MEDEKILTGEESLQLIAEMINKAKNSYVDSGIGPLSWGILITFCSLFTFAELQYNFRPGFDIWNVVLLALIPQVYFMIKSPRQQFKTHDQAAMSYVWGTFVICIFIIGYYNFTTQADHVPVYIMLYGIPTFITGGIKKFRPLLLGGLICFACSIISFNVTIKYQMLLMAVSGIAAWLVPGIILRRKYLKLRKASNV
jgi:hypothetical protein